VTEFLDIAAASGESDLILEEILIPDNCPLAGITLRDSGLRKDTNIIVAAIISASGEMSFNPSGETVISPGATLIGMGKRQDFGALESKLIGGA
jgi:voltage-gated potassium channel